MATDQLLGDQPRIVPFIDPTGRHLPVIPTAQGAPAATTASTPAVIPQVPGTPPVQPQPAPATTIPRVKAVQPTPEQAANTAELHRLETSPSGIRQIKNPVGRTLATIGDVIASGFFPRVAAAIPGTQMHHQVLLNQARQNVKGDIEAEDAEQRRIQQAAEANEAQAREQLAGPQAEEATARAQEARARAASLLNPTEKGGTVHEDAEGNMWVVKQDGSAVPVAAQGQQLKGGTKKEGGTVHEGADGNLYLVHPDGSATPVTNKASGEIVKGKPAGENQEQKDIDEYQKTHPGASRMEAERAIAKNKHIEEGPKPPVVLVPGPDGTLVPQVAQFGRALPAGTVTPGGMSSEAVAQEKFTQGEANARKAAQDSYNTSKELARNPSGPNDAALIMQFMGTIKPENMGKIRFNKPEQDFILQNRSLMDRAATLLGRAQNGQRLSDDDRSKMLETMRIMGGLPAEGGAGGGLPKVGETFQGHKVLKVEKVK